MAHFSTDGLHYSIRQATYHFLLVFCSNHDYLSSTVSEILNVEWRSPKI